MSVSTLMAARWYRFSQGKSSRQAMPDLGGCHGSNIPEDSRTGWLRGVAGWVGSYSFRHNLDGLTVWLHEMAVSGCGEGQSKVGGLTCKD